MLDDPSFVSAQYFQTDPLQARITLHKLFSTNPTSWTRWLFDQLPLDGSGCLLEVGCGPGDLWLDNRERWPAGWTFYLSDLYSSMVDEARRRLSPEVAFSYLQTDAQAIPLRPAQFDLVVANHMLYHVADLDHTLAELARVLKPGASLVAATNGLGHMLELFQMMSRFLPETWFAGDRASNPSKRPSFTLENGREMIATHFREVEVRRHRNGLRVTELEPLLAYIRSLFPGRLEAGEEELEPMTTYLEQQIAEKGAFNISKEVGCILARK
jgi:SAM-dependent methyltransferase